MKNVLRIAHDVITRSRPTVETHTEKICNKYTRWRQVFLRVNERNLSLSRSAQINTNPSKFQWIELKSIFTYVNVPRYRIYRDCNCTITICFSNNTFPRKKQKQTCNNIDRAVTQRDFYWIKKKLYYTRERRHHQWRDHKSLNNIDGSYSFLKYYIIVCQK